MPPALLAVGHHVEPGLPLCGNPEAYGVFLAFL